MNDHGFLANALVFLAATVIAVPLFNRLKLGAVLAYLVAGALLGPHVLKIVQPKSGDLEFAELGVVLLLFLIGLELSLARLWLMRRQVFASGAAQIIASVALLAGVLWLSTHDVRAAIVAGLALAMSSTAIGVQLLSERQEMMSQHGRAAIAVLLFQDLVAIPAIALLPLIGSAATSAEMGAADVLLGVGKVIGALAAVFIGGRYLVRPLFRYVASTRSTEAFTATTLLVVLGTAFLTALGGMSLALGAFLAGLLLADSEFRHEIEASIEPFKGLLLGLFFMSVGVGVDWPFVGRHLAELAIGIVAVLALKFAVLWVIGRTVAGLDRPSSLRLAALLAQGGEFAFVLLTLAASSKLIPGELRDLLTAVVVLSMALTPLVVIAIDAIVRRGPKAAREPYDQVPDSEHPRVVIAGFGRMGQIVARVLRASRVPFVALEQSVEQVELSRRFGSLIYYGDPSKPDVLRAARVESAEIFVLCTDDPEANVRAARVIKRLYPHLKVYARARNRQHAFRLMDLQVEHIVRETFFSSLEIARRVLEGLGVAPAQAAARIARFREADERVLRAQHLVYDDETQLVQSSKDALAELEQLFDADFEEQRAVSLDTQP